MPMAATAVCSPSATLDRSAIQPTTGPAGALPSTWIQNIVNDCSVAANCGGPSSSITAAAGPL